MRPEALALDEEVKKNEVFPVDLYNFLKAAWSIYADDFSALRRVAVAFLEHVASSSVR